MTTDHVNFLFIVYATHLVSELNFNYMRLQILLCQVHSGSSGGTDPPLSRAPPLRLSNTCTDHITGAFPPLLKVVSACKLFHAPSEVTACTHTPELKEEHLTATSCPIDSLSFQYIRLKGCRSLPTGLPLSSARAPTQSAHSCARQTSSQGPVISSQAHFGSSANSL